VIVGKQVVVHHEDEHEAIHAAMAAGVLDRVMNMADVVGLIDAKAAETPLVCGPYRKRNAEISN